MNAIVSFAENKYDVDGRYFDLDTMAETKALLDEGKLQQFDPIPPREACVQIAAYTATSTGRCSSPNWRCYMGRRRGVPAD